VKKTSDPFGVAPMKIGAAIWFALPPDTRETWPFANS
jgi:hypothetical protein